MKIKILWIYIKLLNKLNIYEIVYVNLIIELLSFINNHLFFFL